MSPRRGVHAGLLLHLALAAAACVRPADDRVALDLEVGRASVEGSTFVVAGGLAAVREASPGELTLWAQAPVLSIRAELAPGAPELWTLRLLNALPELELTVAGPAGAAVEAQLPTDLPTRLAWRLRLPAGEVSELRLAPPPAAEPWRFAVLSDIQTAIDELPELFAVLLEVPEVRFVASTGDLTELSTRAEYERVLEVFTELPIPLYSTSGNHDIFGSGGTRWHERFGRHSFQFAIDGVFFTFVDSANATVDPSVYDWLDDWLALGRDGTHVFLTHFPILDPVGMRNGSFAGRREAAKLIHALLRGRVDVVFHGHIHTFEAYEQGGIPSYISGGGGALPMRLDGIGRHFLAVDVGAELGVLSVGLVRVD